MPTRNRRLALVGLALGVLLALVVAPQTRWLVRWQLLPQSLLTSGYDKAKQQYIASHPDDYPVQLAGKMTSLDQQSQVQYARSLIPRFPDSPSLRANGLRYAMMRFNLYRDEDDLLQGDSVPAHQVNPDNPPPTPAELAALDADAAAGERLDPDNAYFPWMRSIGLLAAHRDAEALAAIRRASEEHSWREYSDDEVEGHWRISDGVFGGREALSSLAFSASVFFPHYQKLRAVARIVTYKAILQEQAGHPEAGLALRRQVMRGGDLMRAQSTSLIGSLVGIAISSVARNRPGGIAPLGRVVGESGEQMGKRRLDIYCAYVTRIGHPEAAQEAREEAAAAAQVRQVMKSLETGPYGLGTVTRDVSLSIGLLGACWLTLANAVCLFVLALAARALSGRSSVRDRRPLPRPIGLGMLAGFLLGVALLGSYASTPATQFGQDSALLLLTPLGVVGPLALLPRLRRPIWEGLLSALAMMAGFAALLALAAWQMHGATDMAAGLSGAQPASDDEQTSHQMSAQAQQVIGATLGLAVPLLLAFLLSLVARVRRVPVSVGLVGGFRRTGPLLAAGLVLVYGGLIVMTVRQEARANYGLERSLHGEGQYLARLTGGTWPGPVR